MGKQKILLLPAYYLRKGSILRFRKHSPNKICWGSLGSYRFGAGKSIQPCISRKNWPQRGKGRESLEDKERKKAKQSSKGVIHLLTLPLSSVKPIRRSAKVCLLYLNSNEEMLILMTSNLGGWFLFLTTKWFLTQKDVIVL